jgi:hypothetical protein
MDCGVSYVSVLEAGVPLVSCKARLEGGAWRLFAPCPLHGHVH